MSTPPLDKESLDLVEAPLIFVAAILIIKEAAIKLMGEPSEHGAPDLLILGIAVLFRHYNNFYNDANHGKIPALPSAIVSDTYKKMKPGQAVSFA
jgi:hypothetical protein